MKDQKTSGWERTAPSLEQLVRHLRRANEIAKRSVAMGHHPFGAILVGSDHEAILLEQGNVDTVNHAESVLARVADMNFTPASQRDRQRLMKSCVGNTAKACGDWIIST